MAVAGIGAKLIQRGSLTAFTTGGPWSKTVTFPVEIDMSKTTITFAGVGAGDGVSAVIISSSTMSISGYCGISNVTGTAAWEIREEY